MYRWGSYPAYPAYGNQYAPYPQQGQYQGQGQDATPGAPAPNGDPQQGCEGYPGPRGSPFEDRNENPCNCCCTTATAAKTLAIFNLFYLVWELIDVILSDGPLYLGRISSPVTDCEEGQVCSDDPLYSTCMNYQIEIGSLFYLTVVYMFMANILAYLIATIGFIVALFCNLKSNIELRWSTIFMWSSFCYLGWVWRLLLFFDMFISDRNCLLSSRLWNKYVISAVWICVSAVFTGFVARAYRNMVERKSKGGGQPQGIVGMGGEVTGSLATPGAESSPTKTEAGAIMPYGAVQQGQPSFPLGIPGRQFEDRSENPCRCCCGISTAAKVLAILNLFEMVSELLNLTELGRDPEYGIQDEDIKMDDSSERQHLVGFSLGFYCLDYQVRVMSWFYLVTLSIFIACIAVYIASTIGFMVAIFGRLGTKIELLWSNIYMWISFLYPGWLCHILFFVDMIMLDDQTFISFDIQCGGSGWLWSRYTVFVVSAAVWCVFNGLVGRGYRNMVKRKGQGMGGGGQLQGFAGMGSPAMVIEAVAEAIPEGDDAMSVAESVRNETGEGDQPEM